MAGNGGGNGGTGGGIADLEGVASGGGLDPKDRGASGVTFREPPSVGGIPRGGIGNWEPCTVGDVSGSLKMRMMVSVDWLERDGRERVLEGREESRCCCCRRRYHDQIRRTAVTMRTSPKAETKLAMSATSRRRGVLDMKLVDAAAEWDELAARVVMVELWDACDTVIIGGPVENDIVVVFELPGEAKNL